LKGTDIGFSRYIKNRLGRPYHQLRFLLSRGRATLKLDALEASFSIDTRQELQRVTFLTGEKAILNAVLRKIRPGDVVHDIGANIGTHTIAFAMTTGSTGKVVAFEPERNMAEKLKHNIVLNELENIQVVQSALGATTGRADLYVDSRPGSGRHRMLDTHGWRSATVDVFTCDDLVASGEVPAPNIVKIDVEGGELQVLSGMRSVLANPSCRLVICEVHRDLISADGGNPDSVQQMLEEAGFDKFDEIYRGPEHHLIARK
jgi:FkbM family methyltransferase